MSRWFRVYDDLVDDPKIQRLSPELFRAIINLWCLASKNGGLLPLSPEIAFKLRLRPERITKILDSLKTAGLIEDRGDGWGPHNWDKRQFKSDVSTNRVQAFRQRNGNGDETFPKRNGGVS